jgi:hypothetical protein
MFLNSYSEFRSFRDAAAFARLWLIRVLKLYLTDFLNRIFPGEIAKFRAFFGMEKMKTAAVNRPVINQVAAPWKPAFSLRSLYPSL